MYGTGVPAGERTRPERGDLTPCWPISARPGTGIASWHADRLLRGSGDTELLIAAYVTGGHLIETPRGGSYDLGNANVVVDAAVTAGRVRRGDPEAVWQALDLDRRRAVLAALMTVTVNKTPRGRPAGWKPGQPYFDAASVDIEPKEQKK